MSPHVFWMGTEPKFVNRKEIARIVGVSERRIATLVDQGRLSRTADGRYDVEEAKALYRDGIDLERRAARLSAGSPKPKAPQSAETRKASLHHLAYRAKLTEVAYREQIAKLVSKAEADRAAGAIYGILEGLGRDVEVRLAPHVNDVGKAALKLELAQALRDVRKAFDDASERGYQDVEAV